MLQYIDRALSVFQFEGVDNVIWRLSVFDVYWISGKLSPVNANVDPYHYGSLIWTLSLRYFGLYIPESRQDDFVGCLSSLASSE